jgi:hypothetical protein
MEKEFRSKCKFVDYKILQGLHLFAFLIFHCLPLSFKWVIIMGPFGKAPAPASLAPDPDPREELILLILLENQNHF